MNPSPMLNSAPKKLEWIADLNPPQAEAVQHALGPLVVYAGAGSGKTRVITYRVAYLIENQFAMPHEILAVTFTNKAANEMRQRLYRRVGGATRELWVGTFHATCSRLLRRFASLVGISPNFVVYDDGDQRALLNRILRDLNIGERLLPVKKAAHAINRAKQECLTPDAMPVESPTDEVIRAVYRLYQDYLSRASALDFDDLIFRLVLAGETTPELHDELIHMFRYIMVDEFQDTNQVQLRLVMMLAKHHQNLCVVGDDDQSIYRWRGADRRNLLLFRNYFSQAKLIKLEQNYRSTKRILRAADAVIRQSHTRELKTLWTDNDEGMPISVLCCSDERQEAYAMVRAVAELVQNGYSLSEAAVFYRTHAQSRVLEEALRHADIPYRIVGGMRFYDRAEVKDLIAYLRVIQNLEDDLSLLRIINTPARGIGQRTIERLAAIAKEQGQGLWHALQIMSRDESVPNGTRKKLALFVTLIEDLRALAAGPNDRPPLPGHEQYSDTLPPSRLAAHVVQRTGYLEALKAEDSVEADARIENLHELLGSIEEFEKNQAKPSLTAFLESVSLSAADQDATDEVQRISLMTVHAAKGLEFKVVFVTGLEEHVFPHRGLEAFDDPEELEEERRLAYVAFTRAREQLVLSYAVARRLFGTVRVSEPSRFLRELPEQDVHHVQLFSTRSYAEPSSRASRPPVVARSSRESHVELEPDADVDALPKVGTRVRHRTFGLGRIRAVVPGVPPRATVEFQKVGTKHVVLSYLELA